MTYACTPCIEAAGWVSIRSHAASRRILGLGLSVVRGAGDMSPART